MTNPQRPAAPAQRPAAPQQARPAAPAQRPAAPQQAQFAQRQPAPAAAAAAAPATFDAAALRVLTPPGRLSFPDLFEAVPVAKDKPHELRYMTNLLLPPGSDLGPLQRAIEAALIKRWGRVIPLSAKGNPIKLAESKNKSIEKGDDEDKTLAGHEPGWFVIATKSKFQPGVVDRNCVDIIDPEQVYAGCWARLSVEAYAYDHETGGKGVMLTLNSVQKLRDDARFDGRRSAAETFAGAAPVDLDAIEQFATAADQDPGFEAAPPADDGSDMLPPFDGSDGDIPY